MRLLYRLQTNSKNSSASTTSISLEEGANVAVIGGGPAGSLFSYFLLDLANKVDLNLQVDIYEPRDFSLVGPPGCNMCAGIISESLIQMLAVEGINLPSSVVQRGMDTYVLHTDAGKAFLETPQLEKRIGAVFRGAGPLGMKHSEWTSFDGFLLDQAIRKGAHVIRSRIDDVSRVEAGVLVKPRNGPALSYDFLAVAAGVNTRALKLFKPLETHFQEPGVTRTYVREYFAGRENIEAYLGQHTIHFFLLDLPNLDFAAVIPKGNYITVCILGKDLNDEVFEKFLNNSVVKDCMPPGWQPEQFVCHCAPRINITGAVHPFADRMVFLGDSAISRLYKDGIGAAYRAAKYAATTVVFHGISQQDLEAHYWQMVKSMEFDNRVGKLIFKIVSPMKTLEFAMHGIVRMVLSEQSKLPDQRRMSKIMWDMFTGSAPYRDIFYRFFHPAFWSQFFWYLSYSLFIGRS
ncbi:MAG TPA: hypothetical protein VE136_11520 [Anaerolineales bacterium]|nr:hypothetical protein [Anaerolineales bacterium]